MIEKIENRAKFIRFLVLAICLISVQVRVGREVSAHLIINKAIYFPDKEYRRWGLKIPALGKKYVAKIGSEYVSLKDYMRWMMLRLDNPIVEKKFIYAILFRQEAKRMGIKVTKEDIEFYVNKRVNEDLRDYRKVLKEKSQLYMIKKKRQRYYMQYVIPALIIYNSDEISDNLIIKEFKDKYGVYNKRYKMKIIYKPIKVKYLRKGSKRYKEVIEKEKKDAKKLLKNILIGIKEGKSFEEYARTYSDDVYSKYTGGLLRKVTMNELEDRFGEELAKRIFSLKEGEISEILEGRYGYYIVECMSKGKNYVNIRLIQRRIEKYMVKDPDILKEEQENGVKRMMEIKHLLNRGVKFEKIMSKNYKDIIVSIVDSFNNRWNNILSEKIKNLKKGDISDIIVLDDGVYIVKVDDIKYTKFTDIIKVKIKKELAFKLAIENYLNMADRLYKKAKIKKID